jgi:hypothetical protein
LKREPVTVANVEPIHGASFRGLIVCYVACCLEIPVRNRSVCRSRRRARDIGKAMTISYTETFQNNVAMEMITNVPTGYKKTLTYFSESWFMFCVK